MNTLFRNSLVIIVVFCLTGFVFSQNNGNVYDPVYKFSLRVPDSWKKTISYDGTDKIYSYYTPDENALVQVRVFEADNRVTTDLLAQVYEISYLPDGTTKVALETSTSQNGIEGKKGLYKFNYNNNEITLVAFYTVQNNIGYVVTAMIPSSMITQKEDEVVAVTHSFKIKGVPVPEKQQPQQSNTGALGGLHANTTQNPHDDLLDSDHRMLVLNNPGVRFAIPVNFHVGRVGMDDSFVWTNDKKNIRLIIDIFPKEDNSIGSLLEGYSRYAHENNGTLFSEGKSYIDGMSAYVLHMKTGPWVTNYILINAPESYLVLGCSSKKEYSDQNKQCFNYTKKTIRKLSDKLISKSPNDFLVAGKYNFIGSTGNLSYIKSYTCNLKTDNTFSQKILYNSGTELNDHGTWKVKDNSLILTYQYRKAPDSREVFRILGNTIFQSENGVVYTFMK